jgi:protocatechuate 3,4-dioxygenase, alpha subunit
VTVEQAALPTPSQTVGPFFNIGLPGDQAQLVEPGSEGAIAIHGVVYDGEGTPVVDALVELWQANTAGRYDHPDDQREDVPLTEGFRGFGRAETDPQDGSYTFTTLKPGRVPAPEGGLQAPHIAVSVLARGLLKRLATRIYFADEEAANAEDPVLAGVEAERRPTLLADPDGDGGYSFDIRLQGEGETVFFDV